MENTIENVTNKTTGIIAYLTIIGLVAAFIMNNEKKEAFVSYHIRQSLGIGVTGLALSVIGIIPILGWIVAFIGGLMVFVLWIIGLINAIGGKMKPVPVLGKNYEEWFKSIQ